MIPLFDHHCHSLQRPVGPLDALTFRRCFSESSDPAMADHIPYSLFYRRALRDLAAFLNCEETEDAVLDARNRLPFEQYAASLFTAASITTTLVDTGFPTEGSYTLEEQRTFLPCALEEVLRLETLLEQLFLGANSFQRLEEAFRAALEDVRSQGVRALKSILAYRGGLQIEKRSSAEAAAAFKKVKDLADRQGHLRLSERALLEYFLRIALEIAAEQELPVQFHTGYGDNDADLRAANPLHLRPLFEDNALGAVRFVLLHSSPYNREAGCLAELYSHVYVDLSLAVPFLAHGGAAAIRAALEGAPTSKVLLATDASRIPELFYLGALYARQSLASTLDQLQQEGWLTAPQVEEAAWQILYNNASAIYNCKSPEGTRSRTY